MNDPVLAVGAIDVGTAAAPDPSSVPPTRRARKWPGRLLILMMIGVALIALLALFVNTLHVDAPMHVVIDGEEVFSGLDFSGLPPAHKVVLAGVVLVSLLAALVIVPIALLLALTAVLGVVLLVVGLPLAAVALGLALLLSPLILLGWLLWKLIAA